MQESKTINIQKRVFESTREIPQLTDIQLKTKYKELRSDHAEAPETNREWLLEAVVRLIQHQCYIDNNVAIPESLENKFVNFFQQSVPLKQKRKTVRKKGSVDRKTLDEERVRLLHFIAKQCMENVPNGSMTIHPENKYITVKSNNSVIMFVEKKLRKILAFMGGERGRSKNPSLSIKIGLEDKEISNLIKEFVSKYLVEFSNRRDKRWDKCQYVLQEVIQLFNLHLKRQFDTQHAHPSGRYTTFKKGRSVLVFITQDRAKGEVAFHPGGERENDPLFTTIIPVNEVQNSNDIEKYIQTFLNTHYKMYMGGKDIDMQKNKDGLKKMLSLCASVVTHDSVFQHPNDFFGLIKNGNRPLLMIKRSSTKDCYNIVAWVKKQKNNPTIEVDINDANIATKTQSLVKEHLNFALLNS